MALRLLGGYQVVLGVADANMCGGFEGTYILNG